MSDQEFDKLQIVSGPGVHSDLARFASERRVREAVFVPHPADRVALAPGSGSVPGGGHQTTPPGKGVVDALADRLRIARTRRAIDDVLDAIASFWLVGPAERCGFLSKFIFDALHVPARELTARPQAPIDPSLRQDIERRHAADYVLYTVVAAARATELASTRLPHRPTRLDRIMIDRLIARRANRIVAQVVVLMLAVLAAGLLATTSTALRFAGASSLAALVVVTFKLALISVVSERNARSAHRAVNEMAMRTSTVTDKLTDDVRDLADAVAEVRLRQHSESQQRDADRQRGESNTESIAGLAYQHDELRGSIDTAAARIATLLDQLAAVDRDLRLLAERTPASSEEVDLLLRRVDPTIAEVAILNSEMLELREAMQRLDRRHSR